MPPRTTAPQLPARCSVHSWLPRCPLTVCGAESSASLSALLPPRPGPVLLPFSLLCLRGIQRILLLPDKRSSAKPKCTTVRGVTSQMMRHYGRAENGFTWADWLTQTDAQLPCEHSAFTTQRRTRTGTLGLRKWNINTLQNDKGHAGRRRPAGAEGGRRAGEAAPGNMDAAWQPGPAAAPPHSRSAAAPRPPHLRGQQKLALLGLPQLHHSGDGLDGCGQKEKAHMCRPRPARGHREGWGRGARPGSFVSPRRHRGGRPGDPLAAPSPAPAAPRRAHLALAPRRGESRAGGRGRRPAGGSWPRPRGSSHPAAGSTTPPCRAAPRRAAAGWGQRWEGRRSGGPALRRSALPRARVGRAEDAQVECGPWEASGPTAPPPRWSSEVRSRPSLLVWNGLTYGLFLKSGSARRASLAEFPSLRYAARPSAIARRQRPIGVRQQSPSSSIRLQVPGTPLPRPR